MLLINTSIKIDNNSQSVVSEVGRYLAQKHHYHSTLQLPTVASFTGDYLDQEYRNLHNLPSLFKESIQSLDHCQDHLYFIPTYYKSFPGNFKNFLDYVQLDSIYTQKRIGIISTNAKNQDYGARQFMQVLMGLLEFHKAVSVIVPQILILNPDNVDTTSFGAYLEYFNSFPKP